MLLRDCIAAHARLPALSDEHGTAAIAQRIVSTTGRHQFYTVRVADGQALSAFKGSGDYTSMSLADATSRLKPTPIVEKGETVT